MVAYILSIVLLALVLNALRRPIRMGLPLQPAWLPAMVVSESAPLISVVVVALAVVTAFGPTASGPLTRWSVVVQVITLLGCGVLYSRSLRARRELAPRHIPKRHRSIIGRPGLPAGMPIDNAVEYTDGLTLDLLGPSDGTRPCFIYVHGGSWTGGDPHGVARTLHLALVAAGWRVALVRYPLSPDATFPDHTEGIHAAIDWLRTNSRHAGIDPDRMVIAGGSAGAHLSSLVALEDARSSSQLRACIPMYGVFDFLNRRSFRKDWLVIPRAVMKAPVADTPAYRDASPIDQVHPKAPPFLVLHGTHDSLIPAPESEAFVDALRDVSESPVIYSAVYGGQHGFDAIDSLRTRAVAGHILDFLDEHVGVATGG